MLLTGGDVLIIMLKPCYVIETSIQLRKLDIEWRMWGNGIVGGRR